MSEHRIPAIIRAFRAIFGRGNHCALLVAPDQTVWEATERARHLFNLACEGSVPLPEFSPEVGGAINQALHSAVARVDAWHTDAEGSSHTYEVIAQPIVSDETAEAVLVQAYLITESSLTDRERTLAREAARMRVAAAARDAITAIVSHDLRNPLSTIRICLSGLREEPRPPRHLADELLELVEESVALMTRIIQDLLDVASLEGGRFSLVPRVQPLGPLLRHAVGMQRILAADKSLALRIAVDSSLDQCYVTVDGDRIAQVLSNLISNACKFTNSGGQITVSALPHPDTVQITVQDTGDGIPADQVPHIFDRFWHVRCGKAPQSTGLGLTIARGIIEAHGGRIWVESTVRKGSTFHFTVPRSPRDAQSSS